MQKSDRLFTFHIEAKKVVEHMEYLELISYFQIPEIVNKNENFRYLTYLNNHLFKRDNELISS